MTFISAHFKNTPCLSYFIKRTPMRCTCFKAYFLEVTSHWRTFYKILYTWCIFKMCRNFTYEVVGHRKRPKAIKKIVAQKNKCHFIF
jgi:hypothetical protein